MTPSPASTSNLRTILTHQQASSPEHVLTLLVKHGVCKTLGPLSYSKIQQGFPIISGLRVHTLNPRSEFIPDNSEEAPGDVVFVINYAVEASIVRPAGDARGHRDLQRTSPDMSAPPLIFNRRISDRTRYTGSKVTGVQPSHVNVFLPRQGRPGRGDGGVKGGLGLTPPPVI